MGHHRCIILSLLACVILYAGLPHKQCSAKNTRALYGCPWNADGLANLEIGLQSGRKIGYRFRASYSDKVESIIIYLIFDNHRPGYHGGNGGQVLIELHTDNETQGHHPSGVVLSTATIADPMSRHFPRAFFKPSIPLEKGRLYHLVFSNPVPASESNYVSIDNLYTAGKHAQTQPAVSDTDLTVLWKPEFIEPWQTLPEHTPIFSLYYLSGSTQGQGYIDALSQSGVISLSGPKKVCEAFTISGRDKSVSSVSVRLKKKGYPKDLTIRLQEDPGTLIEEGIVSASAISAKYDWVTYHFRKTRKLKSGRRYKLILSAPPGDPYHLFPLKEGTSYGLKTPWLFVDGYFQAFDGFRWRSDKNLDVQFFFELQPSH